jgi:hypothetical protein
MNTTSVPPAKRIAFWFVCLIVFLISAKCFGLTPEERAIVGQMKEQIVYLRDSGEKLNVENERIREQADIAAVANTAAMVKLGDAVEKMLTLQADLRLADEAVKNLTLERDRLAQDLVHANAKVDAAVAKLHRLKNFAGIAGGILAGLLALLLVLRFAGLSLNTWGGVAVLVGLPLAAFAAVFGAVWTLF